ncbi:hypothetical protein IE53DRAFT_346054 [Violaceomyces palustris]|uniref:Uncharacterized protein n=1 Tax=Violaceomyces palustris TaxID=1673888 RepID=A0ACD0NU21_9BASI|nr:hypothetical protein IE53DRAFT_346054 [Violaceomyces palustris]
MPSLAQGPSSKSAIAVRERQEDLAKKFDANSQDLVNFQRVAIDELVPSLSEQLDLSDEGRNRVALFLQDPATLFRFYRRARYNREQALALLTSTLQWRIRTELDLMSYSTLHPMYVSPPPPNPPLFWINSNFRDLYGRPCGVINLRSVERTAENTTEQLKEFVVASMEIVRRFLADLYQSRLSLSKPLSAQAQDRDPTSPILQMVIAIDLQGSGMANLELELLPFLLDLLKNHFPGMVGAVYILHYGWVHAGMWAVAKRVLPQQALARIFFPSDEELRDHFEKANIPRAYGGDLDVQIEASSNDVLKKYGRPRRLPTSVSFGSSAFTTPFGTPAALEKSMTLSRCGSYESIYEVFYSASGTPWASRPITPSYSGLSTPRGNHGSNEASTPTLKMTPSAARKLKHLQMTRGELSLAAEQADEERLHSAIRSRSRSNSKVDSGLLLHHPHARFPAVESQRQVRFEPHSSPERRVGFPRKFDLHLPGQGATDDRLPSDSESDDSGKAGEKPPLSPSTSFTSARFSAAEEGERLTRLKRTDEDFLARWRDQPLNMKSSPSPSAEYPEDPDSPRLQVPEFTESTTFVSALPAFFSQRSRKYNARDGHVSPYNADNPFFGYPAYANEGSGTTPKHLHARRRKRDLLRTLTYLFVLRILALHRRARWQAAFVVKELARTFVVGGMRIESKGEEIRKGSKIQRLSRLTRMFCMLIFLLAVRPSWRRALFYKVGQAILGVELVYARVSEMRRERQRRDEETWVGNSRSGFHLRERLGIKPSSETTRIPGRIGSSTAIQVAGGSNGKGSSSSPSRYRGPLAVAGSAIAIATLGYYLYNSFQQSKGRRGDDEDEDGSQRRGGGGGPKPSTSSSRNKSKVKPTMSISLAEPFRIQGGGLEKLRDLLGILSDQFLVHLLIAFYQEEEVTRSLNRLSKGLGEIEGFDKRRILQYSTYKGRWAIPRAISCDLHVEMIDQRIWRRGGDRLLSDEGEEEEEEEDRVGKVLKELEKIQKSSQLVLIVLLPEPSEEGDQTEGREEMEKLTGEISKREENDPNGRIKLIDLRSRAGQADLDWSDLGRKIGAFREYWN